MFNYIIFISLGLLFLMLLLAILLMRSRGNNSAKILQEGKSAIAKIIKIENTGHYFNHGPELRFTLEINNGFKTYQATTLAVITHIKIPKTQEGAEIPVKISNEDESIVVIDTEKI